ncbi:hypothetical protein R1sor_025947 [Riccia sorocarpa]|uniref:Reverse transcriptase domain-containing protein n=1 Tax=Riccia sorocarpa TaxID=122646 RepID=A0ABD3GE04_9MARC
MARNCPGRRDGGLNRPPEGGIGVGTDPPVVVPPGLQKGVDGVMSGEIPGAEFLLVKSKSKSRMSGGSRGKEAVSTSSSNRFNLLAGEHGEDPEIQKGEDSWVQNTPPVVQEKTSSQKGMSQNRHLPLTAHNEAMAEVEVSAREVNKSGEGSPKVSRLDKETAQLLRASTEPAMIAAVSSSEWIVIQERERLAEALARSYQDLQNEDVKWHKEASSMKKRDTLEVEEVAGETELMDADSLVGEAVTPRNLCSTAFKRILGERDMNRSSTSQACENNPFRSHFSVLQVSDVQLEIGKAVSFDGVKRGKGPRKKGLDAQKDDWKPIDDGSFGLYPYTARRAAEKRRALSEWDSHGCQFVKLWGGWLKISVRRRERRTKILMSSTVREFKVVSWNVRGLSRRTKSKAVKNWLCKYVGDAMAIGIQEVKCNNWAMNRWMKSIKRNGTVVYDKPRGSRGGTALILHNEISVIDSGVGGQGRLAWAKTRIGDEEIGFLTVHAPNKKRRRLRFWQQVREIMGAGNWCLFGDFNQVEMADDARGKSVVLSGREERVWKDLSLEKGLVDCLFCAAESIGSRFTRMAKKRARFDFSRLDHVYLTNGASWTDHVKKIVHHGTSALSDHQPVSTSIQILPEEGRRRNESYFKMDVFELKRHEVLTKVEEAWKDESVYVREDRRRWARGWHRVRNLLKQVRNEGEVKRKEDSKLAEEVQWRRDQVNEESSDPELDMLKMLEARLKEYEINEARVWRLRYDSPERAETRDAVVRMIQPKLPVEVSLRMVEIPDRLEIERVVFDMKTNKAPGQDGLTIEVLQACWGFVVDDCIKMIHAVWTKKRVLKADCQGIIKLLPKGGEKKRLGNWRPISLMTLTYKIISKILACRLKMHMPILVDAQQTGFVAGRQITDNVLSLKLGQEWASWSGQKGLFVKLDFVKAYDRVDHEFLWSVLSQFGFHPIFIDLVKGFTCGGTAKVHINEGFSQEIKVERGVRHGCPLAPLLFALCSQHFMELIKAAAAEGSICGLDIEPGKHLLHQLFADDTGVCIAAKEEHFTTLLQILRKFEVASGAKVNLTKSLVMPLGNTDVPDWVRIVGCEVAEEGRSFKYLGVTAGVEITDSQCIEVAIQKVRRRIMQWENFYLPWTARVVLIKHVLSLIPSYIMLAIGCLRKEAIKLERIIRDFLWGVRPDGKQKKALVAWARLIRPKGQGGLGILSFESRACSLQMKHVTAIIDGKDVEWANMIRRMLRIKMHIGAFKMERRQWSVGDTLLLIPALRFSEAPTLDRFLSVWFKMRKMLRLNTTANALPGSLPVRSLRAIWSLMGELDQTEFIVLERAARKWKALPCRSLCSYCQREPETVEHIMWGCPRVREKKEWIAWTVSGSDLGCPTFLQILDIALQQHSRCLVVLALVGEFCRVNWEDRNKLVFENSRVTSGAQRVMIGVHGAVFALSKQLHGQQADTVKRSMTLFVSSCL